MKKLKHARWQMIVGECELHIARISHALAHSKRVLPLSNENIENLSDDDITYLDQLIYRFMKLQDTMGEKLFPLMLSLVGEQVDSKPFIDILNRLERLELIPSRQEWTLWRELRNDLAHEYPDEIYERIEAINALSETVGKIIDVYRNIRRYIEDKMGQELVEKQ
jgi:hypothetical protein